MSLLEKIDELREKFSELKKRKDYLVQCLQPKVSPVSLTVAAGMNMQQELDDVRNDMTLIEFQIEKLLSKYVDLPECPFKPCTGRLETTPTSGVLMCPKCQSTALRGQQEKVVHVPAVS